LVKTASKAIERKIFVDYMTHSSTQKQEKRSHRRLELRLPLEFYRTEAGRCASLHSTTVNVSTGGVYFETTAEDLKPGDELALELGVPTSENHFPQEGKIAAISKVIRVLEITKKRTAGGADFNCFGIAAQFQKPLKLTF